MPSPILARADALMQRRRQHAEADDVPVLTDAVDLAAADSDDDVPVLLDIEAIEPLNPLPDASLLQAADTTTSAPVTLLLEEAPLPELTEIAALPADSPSPQAMALGEEFAREIARRLEERLAAELPQIIEATVRDFLAEQTAKHSSRADSKA